MPEEESLRAVKPKLVVLDTDPAAGSELAPGFAKDALDYESLAEFGELRLHQTTSASETLERCAGATIVLSNKVVLSRAILEALPELRFIGVLATGTNIVDLEAARELGIVVSNVPGYSTASTAQLTIALVLELCHQVGEHSLEVKRGEWSRAERFSYWKHPLIELEGKTLGIFGLGAIGARVGAIANALGMRVIGNSRTPKSLDGVEFVPQDRLLEESDVLCLHAALTPETHHFLRDETLEKMKPSALVVNAARGPLVDSKAVARALVSNRLGGFATDVLEVEPPPPDHPLFAAPRVVITPHIAWATKSARQRLLAITRENVAAFLRGTPKNLVM